MSDGRTQLFSKCQRQLIPPVLRWFFMSPLHSESLSCRKHNQYSPFWVTVSSMEYLWTPNQYFPLGMTEELNFSKSAKEKSYLLFHDDLNVLSTFWKFESCTTQDNFSPLLVTWELNFAESGGDHLYLPVLRWLCTFCKLKPRTTKDEFSPSWVTWELNSSKSAGDNSYLRFYDDFLMSLVHSSSFSLARSKTNFSTLSHWITRFLKSCQAQLKSSVLWGFRYRQYIPHCTTQDESSPHEWRQNLTPQKLPETTHSYNSTHSESAGGNSYLLFYDDFDISCTICKFKSGKTHNRVRRRTTFLRYEWHENWTLRKKVGTTHTSWFTMTFISFVYSASFSLLRRKTNISHYESLHKSIFQ